MAAIEIGHKEDSLKEFTERVLQIASSYHMGEGLKQHAMTCLKEYAISSVSNITINNCHFQGTF
jgi:hypothetical protein